MGLVRIGMVGCGLFGESHLRAYRAVQGVKIAVLYDAMREKAEDAAKVFGIPRVSSSLQELCHDPEIDAVDVVTPEETHLEPVLEALRAGKQVFVEKPLATKLTDCDQMIQTAAEEGSTLMVGHLLRFETKYLLLKQELESGRLGKVVSMYARRNRPRYLLAAYGRTHPALENSIHDIDLMLWYAGEPVRRVRGYARNVTGAKHTDVFWGILEFAGGVFGVVETIWLLPKGGGIALDDAFQLIGERGTGNLSLFPGGLNFWREEGFEIPDASYDPRVRGAAHGALRDELQYFCDCVRNRQQPEIGTARDGRNAVRVALGLVDSATTDHELQITEWD